VDQRVNWWQLQTLERGWVGKIDSHIRSSSASELHDVVLASKFRVHGVTDQAAGAGE
jgi:hypothetical protein